MIEFCSTVFHQLLHVLFRAIILHIQYIGKYRVMLMYDLLLLYQDEKALARYHLLLVSIVLLALCIMMCLFGTLTCSKSRRHLASDPQKVIRINRPALMHMSRGKVNMNFFSFFFKLSQWFIWYFVQHNPPLIYPFDLTGDFAGVMWMRTASRAAHKVYCSSVTVKVYLC